MAVAFNKRVRPTPIGPSRAKPAIAMSLGVVGMSAFVGFLGHWRQGSVNLRIGLPFGAESHPFDDGAVDEGEDPVVRGLRGTPFDGGLAVGEGLRPTWPAGAPAT
mgnify:CR=1 FL=1